MEMRGMSSLAWERSGCFLRGTAPVALEAGGRITGLFTQDRAHAKHGLDHPGHAELSD